MGSLSSPSSPLDSFVALSQTVYIRDPGRNEAYTSGTATNAPRIIVILFWMNAESRHIAKYLAEYIKLAPTARIIYITTTIRDFISGTSAEYQQVRMKPAVDAIRASTETSGSVFLHAFSNAGVFATNHLSRTFLHTTGEKLPLKSMVLDSAPGRATFSVLIKVLSYLIPKAGVLRLLGMVSIYVFTTVYWMIRWIARSQDLVLLSRRAINDSSLVTGGIERCYIYSDKDELVGWRDVEEHSGEAEQRGWIVTREKFVGAPHVGHMRVDPDRYWSIIMRIMDGHSSL